MLFSLGARTKAKIRQDKKDGWGVWCAKCCKNIGLAESHAIPRIPIAKGGTLKAENCVILCEECYHKTGENHPEEIPYSELPCFKV